MRKIVTVGDICTDSAFMTKVFISANGCWHWTGAFFNGGYGRVKRSGRDMLAHRYAYECRHGVIAPGLQLDHLCRNRSCVNPDHMEPVTPRENQIRGETFTKTKTSQTHCVHGHPLSGENLYIRPNGHRLCRECHRSRVGIYRQRPSAKKRHAELEKVRRQRRFQMKAFRQGDVLIKEVGNIPNGAKRKKDGILAAGEVTGHHHRITDLDAAYLLENGEDLFMVVTADGGVEIRHEEHAPHVVPPGNYQIVQQEETTFWGKQKVID